jgi:hypothetical protein
MKFRMISSSVIFKLLKPGMLARSHVRIAAMALRTKAGATVGRMMATKPSESNQSKADNLRA